MKEAASGLFQLKDAELVTQCILWEFIRKAVLKTEFSSKKTHKFLKRNDVMHKVSNSSFYLVGWKNV